MYVTVPTLIWRILEAGCWRLSSVLGRLELVFRRWAERVQAAQFWAIDQALAAFQATAPAPPLDFSDIAMDASSVAAPDAVPDVPSVTGPLAPSPALEGNAPRVLH
jgi:hypothetical protein